METLVNTLLNKKPSEDLNTDKALPDPIPVNPQAEPQVNPQKDVSKMPMIPQMEPTDSKPISNNPTLKPSTSKPKVFNSENRRLNDMINGIMNSGAPDTDKLKLLTNLKEDLTNPSNMETESLEHLSNKYDPNRFQNPQNPQNPMMSGYPYQIPSYQQPIPPPYYHNPMMSFNPMMGYHPMMGYQQNSQQFDLLRNKLDTIQMEMIDLTRHLKDYTKRYMNAVREDDMTKLDEYIRSLIGVDKEVAQAKEAIEEEKKLREEVLEPELEKAKEEEEKGMVGKAADGVKDLMGTLGRNFSSLTDVVSNVTNAANNTLSKQILPNNKPKNAQPETTTASTTASTTTTPTTTPTTSTTPPKSKNKNLISIDQYINQYNNEEQEPVVPINNNNNEEQEPVVQQEPVVPINNNDNEEQEPVVQQEPVVPINNNNNEEQEPVVQQEPVVPINNNNNEEQEPVVQQEPVVEQAKKPAVKPNLNNTIKSLDENIQTEINQELGIDTKPKTQKMVQQTGGTRKKKKFIKKRTQKKNKFI
jgi:hypothetical protein